MRHFLKFLPADKRGEAEKLYGEKAAKVAKADAPAPTAAARPRADSHATAVRNPAPSNAASRRTAPHSAAPRVSEKVAVAPPERDRLQRDRPDRDRAGKDTAVAAAKSVPGSKAQPQVATGVVDIKAKLQAAAESESTGVFLSSLENSAIALADTGLYSPVDDKDEAADDARDLGFNPYNRG